MREGIKVAAGTSVRLHVGIEGTYPLSVMWSCNNRDLTEDFRINIDNSAPDHSSLLVKDVSKADTGIYTVKAVNDCGEKTAEIKLLVSGM